MLSRASSRCGGPAPSAPNPRNRGIYEKNDRGDDDDDDARPPFSGVPGAIDSSDYHDSDYDDDDDNDDGAPRRRRTSSKPSTSLALLRLLLLGASIAWLRGLVPSPREWAASPLGLVGSMMPDVSGVDCSYDKALQRAEISRPDFVYEHPYVSSSYYTSAKSLDTLLATRTNQVAEEAAGLDPSSDSSRPDETRLAIVRPFCEFDAEALPKTFTCWDALPPCKAASDDVGDEYELDLDGYTMTHQNNTTDDLGNRYILDLVGSDAMKRAKADVFLFYSQTFSKNDAAVKAVDKILDQFYEPGGWSWCFDNMYAIEANIPQELDLYIPSAQEELYNWVNGPNRQFEAVFPIVQSGEWGEYDGFYLMEGNSARSRRTGWTWCSARSRSTGPSPSWAREFSCERASLSGKSTAYAQYDGDKWDNFYEKILISLLHHTNGNAIYNTSHPLLERLLEVEAPCPYNSIPYDYRMSQMWVEGTLGIVPELAPKIMLSEEGSNITLSDNTPMFKKWADAWAAEDPFKYTPVIHNYAATNLIPRHLGPDYIINGDMLYSPWNPTKTEVTLVVSEWLFDQSLRLVRGLDEKDHRSSEVVVIVPPGAGSRDDYASLTDVPVRTQHRGAPDFMDLREADVKMEWFMVTNSYHSVARHVDLMFTPGTFKPVIPFTPVTYVFCFKYPYCKETVNLAKMSASLLSLPPLNPLVLELLLTLDSCGPQRNAQRINPGMDKVIQDMDMLYNTAARNAFREEWKEANGNEGEDLYQRQQRRLAFRKKIVGPPGPTGTAYFAWLVANGKDGMYKMTDCSLYGARPPFVKVFAREEKLGGMSEDELAKRVGFTLLDNSTNCNCGTYETEDNCVGSSAGCIWRPLFESCHPPELIDGDEPICALTEAPTLAPTVALPVEETASPTVEPTISATLAEDAPEHEGSTTDSNVTEVVATLTTDDDDALLEPEENVQPRARKLAANARDPWYESDLGTRRRAGGGTSTDAGKSGRLAAGDPFETVSLEDVLQGEFELEAALRRQGSVISTLREQQRSYQSEIESLDMKLKELSKRR
ncbi:LOW QUALITY PROTEIN: hypothetical protein ACHAWF_009073 [Thalassiosira exigua]